jgi:predicted DNA-binding protein (MmcQ/YjbR family)
MNFETIKNIALSLPETTESPHFEKTSFRVKSKIFLTFDIPRNQFCVKLSPKEQDLFCLFDKAAIFPVPNKWGKQGWTLAEIQKIPEEMMRDLITAAYLTVAPKKLAESLQKS